MARLLPSRKDRKEWSPLDWVTYIGGMIAIFSALVAGVSWVATRVNPLLEEADGEPTGAYALSTGRLGISFVQNGEELPVRPLEDELTDIFHYGYAIEIEPGSFEMHIPVSQCDGRVNVVEDALAVRVDTAPPALILSELDAANANGSADNVFPEGGGYAASPHAQTEFLLTDSEFKAFNYIVDTRFTRVAENTAVILVSSVPDRDGNDLLADSRPFSLVLGVRSDACGLLPAELVRVSF